MLGERNAILARRGGSNRMLPNYVDDAFVPQHALDVALAQAVYRHYEKCHKAAFASESPGAHRVGGVTKFAKALCRDLSLNPWRTLSVGQRAGLKRCLKPEMYERVMAVARMAAGVGRDAPECLWPENLPKKPPTRKASE